MTEENRDTSKELERLREENESLRRALVEAETRKGVHLSKSLDWEEEKRKADELLDPLRGGPLGRRLAVSGGIHAGLILLTSIGFIFLCLKYGTLEPRKAAAEAGSETVAADTAAAPAEDVTPEASAADESVPGAAADTGTNEAKERMEQALEATSPERPTESKVDLFGSEIDLDL